MATPRKFRVPDFHLVGSAEGAFFKAGYQDKLQTDEVFAGAAILGSQNFSLGDDGKWVTRPGSKYLGTVSATTVGCTSAGKIRRRDGVEIPIIPFNTFIQIFHNGKNDWMTLVTGLTASKVFGFAENDVSTDNVNKIAWGNGFDNYQLWSGVTAMFLSATAATVTVAGTTTLANLGFTATGSIVIEGASYTYTGIAGAGGLQFTGVAPDPSASGYGATSGIAQAPVSYAGNPKGSVFCVSPNARVLVADIRPSGSIYGGGQVSGSKAADPTDFTFASPRLADQGFTTNVFEGGDTVTGLAQFETNNLIFKKSTIYTLTYTTDGNDTPIARPLLPYDPTNSGDVGSVSALAVFRLGQSICFVSPTNVISTIQRVQSYDFPLPTAISDPIKNTVDSFVFDSQTCGVSWRGRAFIACKSSSSVSTNDRVLVYNGRYGVWETPMVGLSIASFFTYGGNLYGALTDSPNVIQLWTGTSDYQQSSGDIPINAVLKLFKQNHGKKAKLKQFISVYLEFDMLQTGSFVFSVQYNENGNTRSVTVKGDGSQGLTFISNPAGAFSSEEFGVDTFEPSGAGAVASDQPVRHRIVLTTTNQPHFNFQTSVSTGSYFKLIDYGFTITESPMVLPASMKLALA